MGFVFTFVMFGALAAPSEALKIMKHKKIHKKLKRKISVKKKKVKVVKKAPASSIPKEELGY